MPEVDTVPRGRPGPAALSGTPMDLVPCFAALTLRPLLEGTVRSLRGRTGERHLPEVARARLQDCLTDPRSGLAASIRQACDRGWETLELGLAGPWWWARTEPT